MPIKIDFLANVRDFVKGTSDVERELDGVADSLDDMAREGDGATEKLESSFRELASRARDTATDVDSIGDKGTTSFRKLGDKGAEVSGELRQNLGETFSSFRGDLEDLPQIAQDTLGGLAGSGALGGIPGLVITAAGAAGLGLLIGAFQNIGAEQEKLKEQTQDWADSYVESGSRVLSAAQLVARGQQILAERYAEVEQNAKDWGVSQEVALAAMAGSPTAIDRVTESMKGQAEAAREAGAAAQAEVAANGGQLLMLTQLEQSYARGKGSLDALTGAMEAGASRADIMSLYLTDLARNTEGATTVVDEFGDSVTTLPDGTTVYVDAETGQATSNVDAIEQKLYSTNGKTATVNVRARDEAAAEMDRIVSRLTGRTVYVNVRSRPGGGDF